MIPAICSAASFPDNSCMRGLYPISVGPSIIWANPCGVKDSPSSEILAGSTDPGITTPEKGELSRLVFRVTQRFQVAFGAFGFARLADLASVPDQLVRK